MSKVAKVVHRNCSGNHCKPVRYMVIYATTRAVLATLLPSPSKTPTNVHPPPHTHTHTDTRASMHTQTHSLTVVHFKI